MSGLSSYVARKIARPSPSPAEIVSATIAAPTTRVAASFNPPKTSGIAAGILILTKVVNELAPVERARWSVVGSTDFSPITEAITIGKNASITMMITRAVNERPNQMKMSGAIAILGITCEATRIG